MKPPSTFSGQIVLYAACAAVTYFIIWPYIRGAMPDSFPAENRSGIEPYDTFGWKGDAGRFDRQPGQGYSPYFPGPRQAPVSPPAVARQQMKLDPSVVDAIEDRRGEEPTRSRPWDVGAPVADAGLRCREVATGREVPLAFCERSGAPLPRGRH